MGADETKTIMRTKAIFVSEEACRLEKSLEMKLKEKAGTNEYANKVLSVVIKAKEQVKIYGDALVKKSCSLPLTLQERTELVSFVKMSYGKMYGKMTSANALVAVRSVF